MRSKGPGFFAQVRSRTNGFVIVLSDRDDELERVRVLRAGADDIWLQPLSNVELAVRLHALLRRRRRSISAELPQEFALPGRVVTTGPITIDLGRRTVELDGTGVPLTRIEFDLLAELCQQPREIYRREELLRAVWHDEIPGDGHVIDVHVSNLRRKLAGTSPGRRYIHTVRGVGFRLSDDVARPAGNLVVLRRALIRARRRSTARSAEPAFVRLERWPLDISRRRRRATRCRRRRRRGRPRHGRR